MNCPKCDQEMEAGILLDRQWGPRGKPLLWVEAKQTGLSIHADPNDPGQWEVDAYRCSGCGLVELYAGLPNDGTE